MEWRQIAGVYCGVHRWASVSGVYINYTRIARMCVEPPGISNESFECGSTKMKASCFGLEIPVHGCETIRIVVCGGARV